MTEWCINNVKSWFKEKFPDEVLAMKQCEQEIDGTISAHHSEGYVWTHTMMCYGEVRNQSDQIKLLILIHDIAKADTQVDKGRIGEDKVDRSIVIISS